MNREKLMEELDRFNKDPRIREALQGKSTPKGIEEAASFLAEMSEKFGYDLKAEDIADILRASADERKAQTEAAAAQIEQLSDDEVAEAVGGKKDHSACLDTFKDAENCWVTDGCDKNNMSYSDYQCKNNYNGKQCGFSGQSCDNVFYCTSISIGPDDIPTCVTYY